MPMLTWPEMHGAITHFPVALIIAGCAFDLAAVVWKRDDLRAAGFWMLAAAVVTAIPALVTGLVTGDQLYGMTPRPPAVYTQHRTLAFATGFLALVSLAIRAWRKDDPRSPWRTAWLLLSLAAAGTVGYTGYLGGRMVFQGSAPAGETTPKAVDTGRAPETSPGMVALGGRLVRSDETGCLNCHRLDGRGGSTAPDLTGVGRRLPDADWHVSHLKDPAKERPGSVMPAYSHLPPDSLRAMAEFLASRR